MTTPAQGLGLGPGRLLALVTGVMLVQQGLVYLATLAVPVAAPRIAESLALDPALLGGYMAMLNGIAILSASYGSGFIPRLGALRVSQISLVLAGGGLALAATGEVWLIALCALLIGSGTAPSTPASSHLLARYSPPRLAPLIFSVKQTGVPLGGVAAGILIPFLVLEIGWQGALLVVGGLAAGFALSVQPLRAAFDEDRQPGRRVALGSILATMGLVLRSPDLRALSAAAAMFVGVQTVYAGFFVLYVVRDVGLSLTAAGAVFAVSQAAAVGARILAGWAADRFLSTRALLGAMGVVMGGAAFASARFDAGWSATAVAGVAIVYACTAFGWNGVLWAEVARRAPAGEVGTVTGVPIAIAFVAAMAFPAIFGLLLTATDSYAVGFAAAGTPALLVGLFFLRAARRGPGGA